MQIFRRLKHAATWVFRERVRRRIAVTLAVVPLTFLVGVAVPSKEIIVGAAVASLALVLVQVIFGVLDAYEHRRLRDDVQGSQRE